jgi:trigger factor
MDVKLEKIDVNAVKLQITVPSEDFEKQINKAYHKNVGKFNIPGFRKGKAPKLVIERMYGEGVFYEDAVNYIIDDTYPKAVEETKIKPVDRPEIDVVDIGKGKDLVYSAKVTVKPEVELGEYKGVEAKAPKYTAKDEDVDKQLQQMREKNARIITKEDGVVEKGNIVVIDFEGFIDGVPFEGGKAENYQLEIGSGTFIDGFEDALVGKKAGDELDVNVKFPENYGAEKLAGKPAVFKVKINEVKYKELSALDDEFAKDVSEFETLEELKADIQKKLQDADDERAKREFEDAVIKKVTDAAKVDIPDVMVDREVEYMMEDLNLKFRYQGINLEQYAKATNTTVDKMKEKYRDVAYDKVKTRLVLEKIGEVESIEASKEDVDAQIEKMSKRYGKDAEKFKASIGERERELIKEDIITNKAIDLVVESAKKTA